MSSIEVLTLKLSKKQNCFISVPRSWSDRLSGSRDGLVVYEVTSFSEKKVYLSWNGDCTHPSPWKSEAYVEINDTLAACFDFKDGQEVIVQRRNEAVHEGRQVVIKPVSASDWDILNSNATLVENNLMNQIRLVWCGMTFPIWIQPNVCISVTVASVSPNFEPVLLVNNTEVVVVPNLTPPEEGGTTSAFLTPSFDEEQPSNVLSALKSLVSSVSSTVTRAVLPPAAASRTPVASSQNVATCETSLI